MNNKQLPSYVHNYYLSTIKKLLGASFVGWEQYRDTKQLKLKINNQVFTLPFEGGDLIGEDSYINLINGIIENGKRRQIQEPLQLLPGDQGVVHVDA